MTHLSIYVLERWDPNMLEVLGMALQNLVQRPTVSGGFRGAEPRHVSGHCRDPNLPILWFHIPCIAIVSYSSNRPQN